MDRGVPILVPDESSFVVDDIVAMGPTTQAATYHSDARLKNRVRKYRLPTLSFDHDLATRYLAASTDSAGTVALVLGAGDKGDDYRRWLPANDVITSDVHLEFRPDVVLDAHWIPFADESLGLVVAGQVLEHTIRPWRVAEEIERVVARDGLAQIEVPFVFPLHGEPWDFFRFTVGGLRSMFRGSRLVRADIAEGSFSGAAVMGASAFTSCFTGRYTRMASVLAGRLGLSWLKYLDRFSAKGPDAMAAPQGIAATFQVDKRARTDDELLADIREVLEAGQGAHWSAGADGQS